MKRRQIAIIPARGGSKRIPRKNVIEIGGRPMLAYPITTALRCGLFDAVYVSTEDDEIAAVAKEWGAESIHRPVMLAQDSINVDEVCLHVLQEVEKQFPIENFCCIYATAAFIEPQDLALSWAMLDAEPSADVVMGVSRYNIHPFKALKKEGSFWSPMWPESERMQSQFHPHLVASNGTLYWARAQSFQTQPTFYPERLKVYEVPLVRAIDIDTPEDLELARLMMRARHAVG